MIKKQSILFLKFWTSSAVCYTKFVFCLSHGFAATEQNCNAVIVTQESHRKPS